MNIPARNWLINWVPELAISIEVEEETPFSAVLFRFWFQKSDGTPVSGLPFWHAGQQSDCCTRSQAEASSTDSTAGFQSALAESKQQLWPLAPDFSGESFAMFCLKCQRTSGTSRVRCRIPDTLALGTWQAFGTMSCIKLKRSDEIEQFVIAVRTCSYYIYRIL